MRVHIPIVLGILPRYRDFDTKKTATREIIDSNLGIPLLVTTSAILDEQGEVAQVIHIAKDITALKIAEMEVHVSANLFEAASDSIMVQMQMENLFISMRQLKTEGIQKNNSRH
jgi:hypothetical protein